MKLKIIEIASHRNGVAGAGFHVVKFSYKTDWEHNGIKPKRAETFIAIVFEETGHVAVISIDRLPDISMAKDNAWRGDLFENDLRKAIADEQGRYENDNLPM